MAAVISNSVVFTSEILALFMGGGFINIRKGTGAHKVRVFGIRSIEIDHDRLTIEGEKALVLEEETRKGERWKPDNSRDSCCLDVSVHVFVPSRVGNQIVLSCRGLKQTITLIPPGDFRLQYKLS